MKKILLPLLLLFAGMGLNAQQVQVLSISDLQPINNCLISNQGNTVSTVTGPDGKADLSKFSANDQLTFSHLAFAPAVAEMKSMGKELVTLYLSPKSFNLPEVVTSANKLSENYTDVPAHIDVIRAKDIRMMNPTTSAELLQQSGTVFVQQSQLGGGSPVLRGMEANRVLLVVDNVRMNNAIYRAGHLQNVITIDPNLLDRVEIIHGPGSVIYGSDAMGGVMHFYTKDPLLATDNNPYVGGSALLRYSSAAKEYDQSVNLNVGGKKIGALIGFSTKDVGDLREGSSRDSKYGDWGKCLYYADRVNGADVQVTNEDPLVQKNSGYKQYDLLAKVLVKPTKNYSLTANFQYSNSSDIPRYDRLTEIDNNGKLVYAQWYYGPQTRLFGSLTNEFSGKTLLYDDLKITLGYQNISEDRVSRKFGKSKTKHQEETVDAISANIDLARKFSKPLNLKYGFEAIYNTVGSKAYNANINTGEVTLDAATRYPDGGSTWTSLAAYLSNSWEISPMLVFTQGVRFTSIALDASYTQEMMDLQKFPFSAAISQKSSSLNGGLGIVINPKGSFRTALNLSTGYRAPNVDDLTKLNEFATDLVIVPNPDLKPEQVNNVDLTFEKSFGKVVHLGVTGYAAMLQDAFVLGNTKYNGQDSILFDGNMAGIQSMQNAAKALIYGVEGSADIQLMKPLKLHGTVTYTKGTVKDPDKPLDHIPPLFGLVSLDFGVKKFDASFYCRFNGWKHIADYSDSGEDNEVYATADGMPSWYTLNLKAAYQFSKNVSLQAGIENMLDKHYRNFASGISAPGRNVFVTLRGNL